MNNNLTGYQALAWICWRTEKAVHRFARADAHKLWADALKGIYPRPLGEPVLEPLEAETQLRRAMASGAISYQVVH